MKKPHQQPNTQPTAEDYYRRAGQHRTAVRSLWGDFVVSFFFAAAALIVLVFFTIAWFVSNTRVNGSTAAVAAKGERYAFTVAQAQSAEGSIGAYKTDGASAGLDTADEIQVNAQNNFLNLEQSGELSPGTSGSLVFTVTPLTDDLGDITIDLQRNLVTRVIPAEENSQAQPPHIITGEQSESKEDLALYHYVQGHILFFLQKDDQGFYGEWLPINEETSAAGSATELQIRLSRDQIVIPRKMFSEQNSTRTTQPVTFTLYWVWPNLFRNVLFTGSGNLFLSAESEAYKSLMGDINHKDESGYDRRSWYFKPASNAATPQQEIDRDTISSEVYLNCSRQYNLADEAIGQGLEYLQIRLVSSENTVVTAGESEGQQAE